MDHHAIRFGPDEPGFATTDPDEAFTLDTFTIEAWFRRQGPGVTIAGDGADRSSIEAGLGAVVPLVAHGSLDPSPGSGQPDPGEAGAWIVGIDAVTGGLTADLRDATGRDHLLTGATVVTDDAWHHLAAVLDGQSWRLFLDGRLEADRSLSDPVVSAAAPLALATSASTDGSQRGAFAGTLDEVRLWGRGRSRAEIREDMHEPVDGSAPGLLGAWALDQDLGVSAPDSVVPGMPLQLQGQTAWVESPLPDDTPPSPPGGLIASASEDGGIRLDWHAAATGDPVGYAVYRSVIGPAGPTETPLSGWPPIATTAYVDAAVAPDTTYRYVVTAIDAFGNESAPSPEATAATAAPVVAPLVDVDLSLTSTANGRVEPGGEVTIDVALTPDALLAEGSLVLGLAPGWSVVDAGAGTPSSDGSALSWQQVAVAPGSTVQHQVRLLAPLASPVDGSPAFSATFISSLEQPGGITQGPSLTLTVAPAVAVSHSVLGQVDGLTLTPAYLAPDTAITDEQRFEVFRVRFRIENVAEAPISVTPQLEVRSSTDPTAPLVLVPALDEVPGQPFYAAREWRFVGPPGGGTELGGDGAAIPVGELLIAGDATLGLAATPGVRATGVNPAPPLELPPGSWTELEFSVRATTDAPYGSAWDFRLSDGGRPISAAHGTTVTLGRQPPLLLSPLQREGEDVAGSPTAAVGEGLTGYRLVVATTAQPTARYALLASARQPANGGPGSATDALGSDPVHGSYGGSTDACALCHASHSGQNRNLLTTPATQAGLCFTCHDSAGTGATSRVQAQYEDPAVPANDPSTGSVFRHDALDPASDHIQARIDEFGGRADRHAECGDCHDPHEATSDEAAQTQDGWTVSGRNAGTSGVAVARAGAGSSPAYTFLDGADAPVTLEYQLCYKCHSGATVLPDRQPGHPSWWAQDKGVEFDPSSASYHPVEAAGRNTSTALAYSLAGTSPYKLWNFTTGSTIRCVNCHGDPRKANPASPPSAGADLAPHAVPSVVAADGTQLNRGLLLQTYRDRVLKGPADIYAAADSALCLVCHKQAPFTDVSGNTRFDTAFRYHGKHVASLRNKGAVDGDIDTARAGRGNALCSECHFRIHSTATRNDFRPTTPQSGSDGGLVLFAPNVTASSRTGTPVTGTLSWTRTGPSTGTCALTCHGKDHTGLRY